MSGAIPSGGWRGEVLEAGEEIAELVSFGGFDGVWADGEGKQALK